MEQLMKSKKVIIGVVVLVLALGALWFWGAKQASAPAPDFQEPVATTTEEKPATTGTQTGGTGSGLKNLPPEPAFTLPAGAVALDDYAFTLNDQVYFRSLTNKEPLAIPNSDAETFKKLSQFVTFPGTEVVSDCGASGTYGFYGDRKNVYFYQFWRAPKFRSSTIEVIVGADIKNFEVTGQTVAKSGSDILKVSYDKATTTCAFKLSKVSFEKIN